MKAIYTKLCLCLLFSCTILVAAKRFIASEQKDPDMLFYEEMEKRRKDPRKSEDPKTLFYEVPGMDIATFKDRINATYNLTEIIVKLLDHITTDVLLKKEQLAWRDLGKKIIFLIEKFSPEMLDSNRGLMSEILLWAYDKNEKPLIKELRERGGNILDVFDRAIESRPKLIPVFLKDGVRPTAGIIHHADLATFL